VGAGVVGSTVTRATAVGLRSWPEVERLGEGELDALLYAASTREEQRPEPDCAWIHRERPRVGVTLQLLHDEYRQQHPDGYGYTAFCDRYREWLARRGLVMRQVHVAGDAMFVDYSGKRPVIVDPHTGEIGGLDLALGRVERLGIHSRTKATVGPSERRMALMDAQPTKRARAF
jgi:transposase